MQAFLAAYILPISSETETFYNFSPMKTNVLLLLYLISEKFVLGKSQHCMLTCLDFNGQPNPPDQFDSKIFDGQLSYIFLPTVTAKTFAEYADKVFLPFLLQQLQGSRRVDCVWDRYFSCSINESTRVNRGSGLRTKVSSHTRLPRKWGDFLRDARNKKELYSFLTDRVCMTEIPRNIIFS